jgi:pyrroloquinoline quinone biosynthesis protein B
VFYLLRFFYCLVILPLSVFANNGSSTLHILGVAQDAGYPQMNCYKPHCMPGWEDKTKRITATSLAIVDHKHKAKIVFEASPDLPDQLYRLNNIAPDKSYTLSGVFLTHAHIGHYTGLMYFGREAAGSKQVPVYAMPKMAKFLSTNGPWSQLVHLENIKLQPLNHNQFSQITPNLYVKPLLVPHRDEFSETVGYVIKTNKKSILFIPDIDKWQKWNIDIKEQIKKVDYAFLDATFFNSIELPNRDMSEVPHPFVVESMELFANLKKSDKQKVYFIHFNHSNPLLIPSSKEFKQVQNAGFNVATESLTIGL